MEVNGFFRFCILSTNGNFLLAKVKIDGYILTSNATFF